MRSSNRTREVSSRGRRLSLSSGKFFAPNMVIKRRFRAFYTSPTGPTLPVIWRTFIRRFWTRMDQLLSPKSGSWQTSFCWNFPDPMPTHSESSVLHHCSIISPQFARNFSRVFCGAVNKDQRNRSFLTMTQVNAPRHWICSRRCLDLSFPSRVRLAFFFRSRHFMSMLPVDLVMLRTETTPHQLVLDWKTIAQALFPG